MHNTTSSPLLLRRWLVLAVTALGAAGIYSLLPFLLRSPSIQEALPFTNLFATALVVHVDLSVLVWFFALLALTWTTMVRPALTIPSYMASITAWLGTILLIVSPFTGDGEALKNNYIPVLLNPTFFLGLACFGTAIALQVCIGLLSPVKKDPLSVGIYSSLIITFASIIAYVLSYLGYPSSVRHTVPITYFESIFWGGGHIMQYAFTQLLMLCWLWIVPSLRHTDSPIASLLFILNAVVAVGGMVVAYTLYPDIGGHLHHNFLTEHMRYGGGVAPLLFALWVLSHARQNTDSQPHAITACLYLSFLVFGAGGIIAYMIYTQNVTIPAHYHGSIVGITIAGMGFTYAILPQLGYTPVKGKLAAIQPYFYGLGQLGHIIGLAWMGGYGALRKTPGTILAPDAYAAMGLFITGGTFAILGGLLYVVIMCRSIFINRRL